MRSVGGDLSEPCKRLTRGVVRESTQAVCNRDLFGRNWTAKMEYLFVDVSGCSPQTPPNSVFFEQDLGRSLERQGQRRAVGEGAS